MPVDQPENPRIRTKINHWNDRDDETIFAILEDLRHQTINPDECLEKMLVAFEAMDLSHVLSAQIEQAAAMDEQLFLLRRHVDHRRYSVLLYGVQENEVHPPHGHHNLISLQIIMRGNIHLREFERVKRNSAGELIVKPVRDAILGPGDVFVATDWKNNVHWFCGHNGPAVIFNINIRGYAPSTFDSDQEDGFGRRYLDPTFVGAKGEIIAEEFGKDEAERRFQGKPLSGFPWVEPAQVTAAPETNSI